MENSKPSFYAIIPATVRYDKLLIPNAKLLYGEITALCSKEGFCWATNKYFAELYDVAPTTISGWISQLVAGGYIENMILSEFQRKIYIKDFPNGVGQKPKGGFRKSRKGVSGKAEYSNTVITTPKIKKANAFIRFGKKGSEEAIIFNTEMDKMLESPDRKYQVIGAFMSFKEKTLKANIRTKGQLYHFCHRWIKDASILVAWDDKQLNELFKTTDYKHRDIDWTLNTLVKELTK